MNRFGNFPARRITAIAAAVFCLTAPAWAQPSGVLASRSHSGQFVLVAETQSLAYSRVDPRIERTKTMLDLDPALLPISCERIKQVVGRELGIGPGWHSKIYLALHPAAADESMVVVTSKRYHNAWTYTVDLPTPIEGNLFVRAIVQAVLTEVGNRNNSGTGAADVPAWLVEGLTQEIQATRASEIFLSSPKGTSTPVAFSPTVKALKGHPLKSAHDLLRTTPPLTFEVLSWPTREHLAGKSPVFSASSHLFLSRLIQLPKGRACLARFAGTLSTRQNWQLAFLSAFSEYFQTPLDVEKWWSLQVVHFTGREVTQEWALSESCKNLRETLQIPVKMHLSTNSLPSETRISLQNGLKQWKRGEQKSVIERKVNELEQLRIRVAPELTGLVEDYRVVLAGWLQRNTHAGLPLGIGKKFMQDRAMDQAIEKLDSLDKRLSEIEKSRQG